MIRIQLLSFFLSLIFLGLNAHAETCSPAKVYSIGEIDPRFHLQPYEVSASAAQAAEYWAHSASFQEISDGGITVELKWDHRQERFLKSERDKRDISRARVEVLRKKEKLEQKRVVYEALLHGNSDLSRAQIVGFLREIESERSSLNREIVDFNETLLLAEKVYSQWKTSDVVGEYRQDTSGEKINVFLVRSKSHLTAVLIHEFGHALGLSHIEKPSSVMNSSLPDDYERFKRVSEVEKEAIAALCP